MEFIDFVQKLAYKHNLDVDFLKELGFKSAKNGEGDIDDAVFDKVLLLAQNNVPKDVIRAVIDRSLDWRNHLDIPKFWHELGAWWRKKIDWNKNQIAQDIAEYHKNIRSQGEKELPLNTVLEIFEQHQFEHDFIIYILERIINPESPVQNMMVNAAAVDAIIWMYQDGWSKQDIKDALEYLTDSTPYTDLKKLAKFIPKQLKPNDKRVSGRDGTMKVSSSIDFIKYVNPVMDIMNKNSEKILAMSNKYKDSGVEFAKAFYKFYVHERGWDNVAPELVIDLDKNSRALGGFSVEGVVILRSCDTQETIVNTIVHELTHFEQYLMLIHSPDFGLGPYAKEHTLQAFLDAAQAYEEDGEERFVSDDDLWDEMDLPLKPIMFKVAKERFANEFYHKAMAFPYKKITKEMPEYKTVSELAKNTSCAYNRANRGNTRFIYYKTLVERMAYAVGNAASTMFHNMVNHQKGNVQTVDAPSRDI